MGRPTSTDKPTVDVDGVSGDGGGGSGGGDGGVEGGGGGVKQQQQNGPPPPPSSRALVRNGKKGSITSVLDCTSSPTTTIPVVVTADADDDDTENTIHRTTFQVIFGVIIVLGVTVSWTGATQFTKSAYDNTTTFNSPYFLVYFSTSWMTVCYPLLILCQLIGIALGLYTKPAMLQNIRDSTKAFGPEGMTLVSVFRRVSFFLLFWFIANYSYSRALSYISPTDVTAIFSSNLAFVYLLTLCILKDKIYTIKIISILASICGIVLMAYQEGFQGVGLLGVALVVIASIAAAIYKVAFKRIIGDASFGQVSLFMSVIGVCDAVFVWPIMLGITLSGAETVIWSEIPWTFICSSSVLSLAFNFLVNLGIAVTHPLFVSVGIFLGYPLNAMVDVIFRDHHLGTYEIIGSILIVLGFLLMLLPDSAGRYCYKRMKGAKKVQGKRSHESSI